MASEHPQREQERKPARRWDYSRHVLKDGGTQIVAVVVGFAVTLVLRRLLLAGVLMAQHPCQVGRIDDPAGQQLHQR